ncbi:metal ABC transporter permease [Candidatus Bathyarchaeota archaeon]|nr:metal ABC transporter permease [Candidatus Bathyarchaeota archaeon]
MLDPFVLKAILGLLFASLSVPISVIMLLRGSLYITPEISHAALGGAAIGVLIQTFISSEFDPFLLVLAFCVATSILVSYMGKGGQQSLGMMLSVSLAISVTVYAVARSYLPADKRVLVDGYLISDPLLLSEASLLSLAAASAAAAVATIMFYREFIYICFDMETAEALGLKARFYDLLIFSISAVTVAVVTRALGVLLSVTLLIIPAAASRLLTQNIGRMLAASFIIAVLSGLAGIILSLFLNIPTSGAIALVSIMLFSAIYIHHALSSL